MVCNEVVRLQGFCFVQQPRVNVNWEQWRELQWSCPLLSWKGRSVNICWSWSQYLNQNTIK